MLTDPVPKGTEVKILGSILVALSGACLFLDKVFVLLEIEGNTFGFSSYSNFIWVLMTSFVPISLGLWHYIFKPYALAYLIPLYCYSIQIIWTFQPNIHADDIYLHIYALGSCVIFIILLIIFKSVLKHTRRQQELEKQIRTEATEIIELLKTKLVSES